MTPQKSGISRKLDRNACDEALEEISLHGDFLSAFPTAPACK
jgi:hypothetical protein